MSKKFIVFLILNLIANIFCKPATVVKIRANASVNASESMAVGRKPRFVETVVIIGVVIVGGLVSALIAEKYADHLAKDREKYFRDMPPPDMVRSSVNCTHNNFGCYHNICWTNCGPRLAHNDFCFTVSPLQEDGSSHSVAINDQTFKALRTVEVRNQTVQITMCNRDAECGQCWPCGTTCTETDI